MRSRLPLIVGLSAVALPLSAQAASRPHAGSPAATQPAGPQPAGAPQPGPVTGTATTSSTTTTSTATASTTTTTSTTTSAAPPAPPPAPARLAAAPARPVAGQTVRLVILSAPTGVSHYRWDLTGGGAYSLDTGPDAVTTTKFATAGSHHVSVELDGATVEHAALIVDVQPKPVVKDQGAGIVFGDSGSGTKRSAQRGRPASKPAAAVHHGRVAHSSGDPGVTIADFRFAPGTTTVHAGDTVTWTNNGPSPHTATASNGSFNTGTLHPGQSASHTFTQAGTFTYICSIHPFMHGTIVVLASTSSPSSNSSPSSSSPSSSSGSTPTTQPSTTAAIPTTTSTTTAQTLPDTGMNVGGALLAGLVILGLGLLLRAAATRPGRG